MLDKFEAWYHREAPKLEQKGCSVEFKRPRPREEEASTKRAAYVDILSDVYGARITVWNTGESDLEVLDYQTGASVFFKNHVFPDDQSMVSMLDNFCTRFFIGGIAAK